MREPLLGKDPAFRAAVKVAEKAAASQSPAVFLGQTGTGKSHLARWMARRGPQPEAELVEWNASAVSSTLFEAELFGVEAGAATGVTARPGICEAAGEGMLCFSGIENLPHSFQAAMLRLVAEKSLTRVGGAVSRSVRARFLFAFQEPPESLAAKGLLRSDLLYRLDVIRIELPPLSRRKADILPLFRHFLSQACKAAKRRPPEASRDLLEQIESHPWPGNLWQLRQTAHLLAGTGSHTITAEDLPPHFWIRGDAIEDSVSRRLTLSEMRDAYIMEVLAKVGGNRSQAARWLGISRKALWEHLKRRAP